VPEVPSAYAALARRLGTDQIIWCYTQQPDRRMMPSDRVEWALDVPTNRILAFMDDYIWNRIIGLRPHAPPELRRKWRADALHRHPHDPGGREQFRREQEKAYRVESPPNGDWWSRLFASPNAAEGVTALIAHPFQAMWVKSRGGCCRDTPASILRGYDDGIGVEEGHKASGD
jgi:hypothetical protein